jgi:hypothetical protein
MSDNEIDKLLDDLRKLNSQLGTGDIQLDLNAQMSEFIKILFGKDESGDDKIAFLKSKSPVDRKTIDKDKFKDFIGRYQSILKGPPVESASNNTNFGSFDGTFHETQENQGCGRHALNNLLGGKFFTSPVSRSTFKDTKPYTLNELKIATEKLNPGDPIDLQKLCKYLNRLYSVKYGEYCDSSENYDQMILKTALELIGFDIAQAGKDSRFGNDAKKLTHDILKGDVTGILINTGSHWTSVRKHEGKIFYMDSVKESYETKSKNEVIDDEELDLKLNKGIYAILVGSYNELNGKKTIIRLKIEEIAKTIDDNVNVTLDAPRNVKGLIYDNMITIIDDITDVSLIEKLYNNEIQIDPPYERIAGYITTVGSTTSNKEKLKDLQTELVDLLTTPKK